MKNDDNQEQESFDGEITDDDREKILDKAVMMLGEHFDIINLLVSYVDDEGMTHSFYNGRGNWHARMGQTQSFLITQEENYRMNARKKFRENENTDDTDFLE